MFQRVSVVVSAARHWRTGHGHSGEDELAPLRGSGHLGSKGQQHLHRPAPPEEAFRSDR